MRIHGAIDFTITEQNPKYVVAEMSIQEGIKNPFGVVHAGATLWIADVAATVLAITRAFLQRIIPAPTVLLAASSMTMKAPVARFSA